MPLLNLQPLERRTFGAAQLMEQYPPKYRHRNKQIVFQAACPEGCRLAGTINYSRWPAAIVPERLDLAATDLVARADVYDYEATEPAGAAVEWHVNFADPYLFIAYASSLLAQDEMQVAEHPVLASLKEALDATGKIPCTVEGPNPTPILIRGAERRVRIATDPDPDLGRPYGLYGNRFGAAKAEVIEKAIEPLNPPTITNLIAIAAPSGGSGRYTRPDIDYIVSTALTGFAAAALESHEAAGADARTIIHTGFWGCGAFGGNRVVMALLQILAARMAGVDRLVFHTFNRAGMHDWDEAKTLLDAELSKDRDGISTEALLNRIVSKSFRWGESDGN